MPSPTSRTVPVSSTWRSTSKDSICWRMIELISSVRICGMALPIPELEAGGGEAPPHVLQGPADGPVEDPVSDVDPEPSQDLRIDRLGEDDRLPRALLQGGTQCLEEIVVELPGGDDPGLDPVLVHILVTVELLDDVVEQRLAPLVAEAVEQSEDRAVYFALKGQVHDPALVLPAEPRQEEERPQVGLEPIERVVDRVQVVGGLPDRVRLDPDVEQRLGVDPGRCMRNVHSLVATSSTTSWARRRWSSSRSSRLRSRADASRVSSTVTCFSPS